LSKLSKKSYLIKQNIKLLRLLLCDLNHTYLFQIVVLILTRAGGDWSKYYVQWHCYIILVCRMSTCIYFIYKFPKVKKNAINFELLSKKFLATMVPPTDVTGACQVTGMGVRVGGCPKINLSLLPFRYYCIFNLYTFLTRYTFVGNQILQVNFELILIIRMGWNLA